MPKLKTLSGKEVLKIFLSFGFNMAAQKGSHIKLARVQKDGTRQTLTIMQQRPDLCQLKVVEATWQRQTLPELDIARIIRL